MSLDVYLEAVRPTGVYWDNITHNLGVMAKEAGLYEALWRPDEVPIDSAAFLAVHLREGLARLKAEPERYRKLNPENGWGSYERLVEFVEKYIAACEANPDARIRVSR